MKRFAPAIVAAATAMTLVAAPVTNAEETTATAVAAEPADQNIPTDEDVNSPAPTPINDVNPGDNGENNPAEKPGSSFSVGTLVGVLTALVAAVSTTALIVASNPSGINKIADLLQANGVPVPPLPRF
ncbi:hypothetical protein [Corynebacterium mayonis]|uniref:hypothetical protein n=1 Tax=Corynebacterium mayonis TaxID=3062461 RepID=UPI00313FE242